MVIVEGMGDKPIQVRPVVYDSLADCGVAIIPENGRGFVWGLVAPRNIIAAWRATEILRCLKFINPNKDLAHSYYAGLRQPRDWMTQEVSVLIRRIGRSRYNEIMSLPVPDKIIKAILDSQSGESSFMLDTRPIKEEINAGTIKWRKEFSNIL
ncbi:MAG: hypothetical protein NTY12_00950 [Candidatus Falkowbacteria bacterium]|nr:hypothetical protein [Candidatus Falkowbacteria bacterium]